MTLSIDHEHCSPSAPALRPRAIFAYVATAVTGHLSLRGIIAGSFYIQVRLDGGYMNHADRVLGITVSRICLALVPWS
jgi:hypothetical protein